jgi:hypothetical protein
MTGSEQQLSAEQMRAIQHAIVRLRAAVMSVVFGLAGGAFLFFVTIWLVLRGPAPGQTRVGPTLGLLRYYFPGYEVSVLGSFIGFFYGALAGALIGWVIAVVYNSVAGYRLGDHRDAPST